MKQSQLPPDWDQARIDSVLSHYEAQSDDEAVAEDEATFHADDQAAMDITNDLGKGARFNSSQLDRKQKRPITAAAVTAVK